MNWLDVIVVIAIVIFTFLGLRMGIIKAVLSLAGLIVGVVLAGRYYVPFSGGLTFISSDNVAKIVAFAIILIGVMVVARVVAGLLKRVVSMLMLGWIDRVGGAIFGLVLGATLCGALLAIWIKYLGMADAIADSALAFLLLDRLPMVLALLPGEFDGVRSFFY